VPGQKQNVPGWVCGTPALELDGDTSTPGRELEDVNGEIFELPAEVTQELP